MAILPFRLNGNQHATLLPARTALRLTSPGCRRGDDPTWQKTTNTFIGETRLKCTSINPEKEIYITKGR